MPTMFSIAASRLTVEGSSFVPQRPGSCKAQSEARRPRDLAIVLVESPLCGFVVIRVTESKPLHREIELGASSATRECCSRRRRRGRNFPADSSSVTFRHTKMFTPA